MLKEDKKWITIFVQKFAGVVALISRRLVVGVTEAVRLGAVEVIAVARLEDKHSAPTVAPGARRPACRLPRRHG